MSVCLCSLLLILLQFSASFALQVGHEAASFAFQEAGSDAAKTPLLTSGLISVPELSLDFKTVVPEGEGPFPVVILLHASFEDDLEGAVNEILWGVKRSMGKVASTHILVGVYGEGSWNVVSEPSKRDDATLISTQLTQYLATFGNVLPEFKLFGFSNGAGLTNRILIENDDPQITTIVTCGSQLNYYQWHDGSFYIGGEDNAYTTPKPNLQKRRVLQLTGDLDTIVPANGGRGEFASPFLAWSGSAYYIARAYGYNESGVSPIVEPFFSSIGFLQGQVQAFTFKNIKHDLEDYLSLESLEVIESFLLGW